MMEHGAWAEREAIRTEQLRVTEVYQTKLDVCLARIERLTHRMRTQERYHEPSDQERDGEIDRMIGDDPREAPPRRGTQRARVPTTEIERWINQFREEFRNHAVDGNTITHCFQQFLEEHQRLGLKGMLRNLARQVESLQGGAHSGSQQPENSASVITHVDDLKTNPCHKGNASYGTVGTIMSTQQERQHLCAATRAS